jgi:hypothetical protein
VTGGATGSGGAGSGGATGSGGVAVGGATGNGGTTGAITPADIVPDLDGFYWEGTCVGSRDPGGHNCPLDDKGATCPSGTTWDTRGTIRDKTIPVKGTAGQKYTINFEVRGVIGTRCYTGGKRASTAAASEDSANNTWYVGGKQYNDSIWNTYEIHVSPATGDADVYFMNAFGDPGGTWCEKEASYEVKYTASFKVVGGGTLKFTIHDSNCQAQQNCGTNPDPSSACAPRTVDLTGMSPAASFSQPPANAIGAKSYKPQWLYFDVTSVTSP